MTALSLVYPIQNLVNSIAVGFGVGINAVVAFHLGAGEMQNVDRANNLRIISKLYTRTYTYRLFNIQYAVLRKKCSQPIQMLSILP